MEYSMTVLKYQLYVIDSMMIIEYGAIWDLTQNRKNSHEPDVCVTACRHSPLSIDTHAVRLCHVWHATVAMEWTDWG